MQPHDLTNNVLPCVLTMAACHRAWATRYAPWLLTGPGGATIRTLTIRETGPFDDTL